MKFYEASTPKEALRAALNDEKMSWSKFEKAALEKIISNDDAYSTRYHTGMNWKARKDGKMTFHTCETENGFKVARLM